MSEALISPQVLQWACERAHVPVSVLADKVSKKAPLWFNGQAKPTLSQAQKVSKMLHVPLGYLFLNEPPLEPLPLPDLRTVGDVSIGEISVNLREVILDAQRKQEWYKDYAIEQGIEPLSFIGKYSIQFSPVEVARDISETLGINNELRRKTSNWEVFLNTLIEKSENIGILMMHSGIVGSNTHRPLDVNEFRGFAISDPVAPLIFINWKDAKAARIFTLVHELAHLWMGQSGISDVAINKDENGALATEKFCNAVAAEVLVPEVDFKNKWDSSISLSENAYSLVRHYRVSSVVVARRAYELGFVQWDEFILFYQEESKNWQQQKSASGGDYYTTTRTRLGSRFAKAVIGSVQTGKLLYRDAGHLLGVKPANIANLSKELGMK